MTQSTYPLLDHYKKPSMIIISPEVWRVYSSVMEQIERDAWTDAATTAEMEYEWLNPNQSRSQSQNLSLRSKTESASGKR